MDISKQHKYIHPVRAGSMVETFADIAEQAFGNFLDEAIDPAATVGLSTFEAHRRLRDRKKRRQASGIKTIVFSAMAIEAAAFEFTALVLGDKVAKGDLDKGGLVRKWVTGTGKVCGQSLDVNGPAIKGLECLVKARNALVHHKSKLENEAGTVWESMTTEWARVEKDEVPNAFKTLVLLSLELEALPSGFVGIFPYRDEGLRVPPGFINDYLPHPRVKEVINHCRDIHREHLKGA